ncbi:alpha/beta hydrolase [Sabulilitoribacter multivorans]|uniref:Alpha/beta hydrolase n=1 Tax=Flaviramulus multivorans TaxID=1304750 RepID=A0ABS9IGW1_9FLAO|nr:alpha/beta hydrolase [Flaviramulus multivorans]MCF7559996.1 alpha/beta hydrolase [Flaviramulus multivorans]
MKTFITAFLLMLGFQSLDAQDGNFVETNGVKIYYETHGEGEPLLLLHGFSLSHKAWDSWIDDLSHEFMVITPDLRGHGNSTNPSKEFTHELSAQDIYGLLDALKIDKVKAIGQSTGAMTLTHMATMDSTRISSMILVSGTTMFPLEARKIMETVTYERWKGHMEPHQPRGEEQIRILVNQFRNFAKTYNDMNFTSPYLATITCPTLIIHGDRDDFFPVDIPISFYKSIPNSYLWIVPNDGHIPIGIYGRNSIWSDVFYKVLIEFFNGTWD